MPRSPMVPASRSTLGESVANALRDAILGGRFKPGERVVESQVARELGVSQAPVRDALGRLERLGLVERRDRAGTYVPELSPADAAEIYSLRLVLEMLSFVLVIPKATPELLARLEENVRTMAAVTDPAEVTRIDLDFHAILAEACGHGRMRAAWEALRVQSHLQLLQWMRDPEFPARAARYHRTMLDLIRGGDRAGGLRMFVEQLEHLG